MLCLSGGSNLALPMFNVRVSEELSTTILLSADDVDVDDDDGYGSNAIPANSFCPPVISLAGNRAHYVLIMHIRVRAAHMYHRII